MATAPSNVRPLSDDIAAMAFVQSSSLCQGVPAELLTRLFSGGVILDYAAGSVIFAPGDTDDALYLIVEGSVVITKLAGSREVAVAALERQAVFGEGAVLTQRCRTSSAVARIPSLLVRLPGEVVRAVAEAAPRVGRKLAGLMAGRTRDTEKKLAVG